jgi:protein-S-isoprenylcysteine O-methyltransferase Ste14
MVIVRHPTYSGGLLMILAIAAGLGVAFGLRLRGIALRRHRGAASRRRAVSLNELTQF